MQGRPGSRIRLGLALATLAIPLLAAGPAQGAAPVSCTLVAAGPAGPAGDVLEIVDQARSVTQIYRKGDEIVVSNNLDRGAKACAGGTPTVFNVDRIEYSTATGVPFLNYGGSGAFAPGASPEPGAAEIEISIAESYEPKVLNVAGTAAGERIEIGELGRQAVGVNLNAELDESAQDADVSLDAEPGEAFVRVMGRDGDDTISGRGGAAFTGPVAAERLALNGGDGDDLLLGSPYRDFLSGDEGDDRLLGGRGRDNLAAGPGRDLAKGGKGGDDITSRISVGSSPDDVLPDRIFGGAGNDSIDVNQGLVGDRVDCGSGAGDEVFIDPQDQAQRCEDVEAFRL